VSHKPGGRLPVHIVMSVYCYFWSQAGFCSVPVFCKILELDLLDMIINIKEPCYLRIGLRNNLSLNFCSSISTSIRERNKVLVFISNPQISSAQLITLRFFCRADNAIFDKIGRITSKDITAQIIKTKCIPIVL